MGLPCLFAIYMSKIRVTLFPFASDFVSSLSVSLALILALQAQYFKSSPNPLPPLPDQQIPINNFISMQSHCALPKVQGDLQREREHCGSFTSSAKAGRPSMLATESLSSPSLVALSLDLSSERLNGVSFPHHPAHKTVPGPQ